MGARLVQDINPAGSSSPNELISFDGLLFFSAELEGQPAAEDGDGGSGAETSSAGNVGLVRSDGSDSGTTVLRRFDSITNLVKAAGKLYFVAEINDQYQLWTSDGTTRGTQQVQDLYPNADSRFPQNLFEIDGVLFYGAINENTESIDSLTEGGIGNLPYVNVYEIWRLETNDIGSRFFRNLIPDKIISTIETSNEDQAATTPVDANGNPISLTTTTTVEVVINTATDGTQTTTTTTTIDDENYIDGRVVTTSTTSTDVALTVATDVAGTTFTETPKAFPTTTETVEVADVTTEISDNNSFPKDFTEISGNYFFSAYASSLYSVETNSSDTIIGGLELWFSDGTEAGTRPININQNTYTFYQPQDGTYSPSTVISEPGFGFSERSSSSFPRELTPVKNRLYFVANDGNTGFELWSISDQGTNPSLISDLQPGNNGSSPSELTAIGKTLYFSADVGDGRELYYYKPSLSEPKPVKNAGQNPESLTAIGKTLYFSAESDLGRELWSAKGDRATFIKDINPGSESSSPEQFTMTKRVSGDPSKRKKSNYLYFTANDGTHGNELMSLKLRGKGNKIKLESDINDGPRSSLPRELTIHDQQLFFTANQRSTGRELWTVGPSIQGPTGEAGADSTETIVFENQTFVYQFSSQQSEPTSWTISSGADASLFKINSSNGKLSFRQAPDFERPRDQNRDNTYELFVRSTVKDSGYKADQEILINVANVQEDSEAENGTSGDEILYYSADCGPITANGPLYPCDSGFSSGSGTSSGSSIPTVSGNSNLSDEGRTNYNNYNDAIDDYERFDQDCDFASSARFWAEQQIDENDTTLAEHYNRYFSRACDLSELII